MFVHLQASLLFGMGGQVGPNKRDDYISFFSLNWVSLCVCVSYLKWFNGAKLRTSIYIFFRVFFFFCVFFCPFFIHSLIVQREGNLQIQMLGCCCCCCCCCCCYLSSVNLRRPPPRSSFQTVPPSHIYKFNYSLCPRITTFLSTSYCLAIVRQVREEHSICEARRFHTNLFFEFTNSFESRKTFI